MVSVRLVDFKHEMFNDAMYFLEQAKALSKKPADDWIRWRYLRASILFSAASAEAFLNTLIQEELDRRAELESVAKKFRDVRNFNTKIDFIFPLVFGKAVDRNCKEWKDYELLRRIRNSLAHYSGGTKIYRDSEAEGINIENAEKSIEAVRNLIKYIYELLELKCPEKWDWKISRTIR